MGDDEEEEEDGIGCQSRRLISGLCGCESVTEPPSMQLHQAPPPRPSRHARDRRHRPHTTAHPAAQQASDMGARMNDTGVAAPAPPPPSDSHLPSSPPPPIYAGLLVEQDFLAAVRTIASGQHSITQLQSFAETCWQREGVVRTPFVLLQVLALTQQFVCSQGMPAQAAAAAAADMDACAKQLQAHGQQ